MSQSKCRKNEFSAMFWNVEHFGRDPKGSLTHEERVELAAKHITCLNPDLFCLCEIYDKVAFRGLLMNQFSDYDFAVTDDKGSMNLVVGWRRGKFEQVVFTQRGELQAGREKLRPGALTSVKFGGEWFNFLFLHLKSASDPGAHETRQNMFGKIWSLRCALDRISEDTKFVVMGDLNTVGRDRLGQSPGVSADAELQQLEEAAESEGMRRLPKTHRITWPGNSRFKEANLDHVLATTDNVRFQGQGEAKDVPTTPATGGETVEAEVRVSGWNTRENDEDRQEFIDNISDHCSLFCKIVVGECASESTSDDAESS